MSSNDLKEDSKVSDDKATKLRKRYTLWGKIVIGISITLLIVGFLGFIISSMEFMEDFFDDDDAFSPVFFMIPFVLGMFGLAGGNILLGLGKGKIKNTQAHTIIISESGTTDTESSKQEEKKGGKCPNCGAPYKAEDKTCKYCGSDL